MAYEDWMTVDSLELFNVGRTVLLSRTLGIDAVRVPTLRFNSAMEIAAGGSEYANIEEAPWYDAQYIPSQEFAGVFPLSVIGLGDSTRQASVTEFITDGGQPGIERSATNSMVFSAVIAASTDRGADFGKRYLDRVLRGLRQPQACGGSNLNYSRTDGRDGEPVEYVHMRDVSVTRATSITKKRRSRCQTLYWVQWTMTAADPFEYGAAAQFITSLGGANATGPRVTNSGTQVLVQNDCAQFNYTPIYDPLYPALVTPPTAPNFLPAGWGITNGMNFQRKWAVTTVMEPSALESVPIFKIESTTEARMIRVQVFNYLGSSTVQCSPRFSAILTYLPPSLPVYLDGEQAASYAWDGSSAVRRTDSLVYSPGALPMRWNGFDAPNPLLVTLDLMQTTPGNYQGGGNVRVSMSMMNRTT